MSYQLPQPEEKARYVQSKFDEIAPKYDVYNDVITFGMHRYWKKFLVRRLGLGREPQCLDLCCGTADLSKELLKTYSSAEVIALDFSQEMLKVAQKRFQALDQNCFLVQGNAMEIPFSDKTFDAVTIGFGLRNVADLQTCLLEIVRVLKPGGVFACLDVGKVNIPLISAMHHFFFFFIVPWIGKCLYPGQEMFDYLPHSSTDYPNQERLKRLMLGAGFKQVDVYNFMFGASALHLGYCP
ncbi:bifunctional demethylmenaquinone methyltransferase/2-methoxy-6-polyprenyl-1,4-benzoquinol methylase UbiE [Deltaproteobacteria bacterium TL4]